MSTSLQVVLTETLPHLGAEGDVVKVRGGYARNYLIPRGLAIPATRQNLARVEHEREIQRRRVEKEREGDAVIAKQLADANLMVAKEASEDGKLFGSVTSIDIAEAAAAKGIDIDRRKLSLPDDSIKSVGNYEVGIKFASGLNAKFTVIVKTRA